MKKITSSIAVVLASIFIVTGCNTNTNGTTSQSTDVPAGTTDPITINETTSAETTGGEPVVGEREQLRFWVFHTGKELEFFQKHVDAYNQEQSNVEIVLEEIPWDDYNGTKMTTAFASEAGPDIFLTAPGNFLKYANSDILTSFNDVIPKEVLDDFSESSLDAVSVDGQILAIPFEMELLGLYYSKSALAEAGVEPPKTWEELNDAAAALTTSDRYGFSMEANRGTHQLFEWYPFVWQTGEDLFSADGKSANLAVPGIKENLELKRKMYEDGVTNLQPSRPGNEIGVLAEGETAMQLMGTWGITQLTNDYPDKVDDIGLVPIPVMAGGEPASVAGGWKITANARSANVDESAKFAAWLFAGDPAISTEWCTEIKFAYSPRASVTEANPDYYNEGLRKAFTDQILGSEQAEKRLPPEISDILQDFLQSAYFDTVDMDQLIEETNTKINEFLATYDGTL